MVKVTDFATDETKEKEGAWVEYKPGFHVKVASAENREYTRFMLDNSNLLNRRSNRLRTLDFDKIEDALCRGIAKHILFDWKGLEDAEGKPLEYSEARALEYLRKYRKFREGILEIAQDEALFEAEQVEEEAKNSSTASDGS